MDVPVEKQFKQLTGIEHILQRPDTYVGSCEKDRKTFWMLNSDDTCFEERELEFVPALFKIFDEILVNAADNSQRNGPRSQKMTYINVDITPTTVSIENDGMGIPVEFHETAQCYVQELIFGRLLTGSNFDDNQKRTTGGRNGYGAKLANVFSTMFVVECGDAKNKKRIKIVWKDNMVKANKEPEITKYDASTNFTKITFKPDFPRFKMGGSFEQDTMDLFKKRVWDLAGVLGKTLTIKYNGFKIPIKSFRDYSELYIKGMTNKEATEIKVAYTTDKSNWEVLIGPSSGDFHQMSFVNSIATTKGGTHVDYLVKQICEGLLEEAKKKVKKINIKPSLIKSNFFILVNCLIVNPAFDSQTKECLTTRVADFGSEMPLPANFFKDAISTGLLDLIIAKAQQKEDLQLAKLLKGKKTSRLFGIEKLEDANKAGTRDSLKCTLILTEGDSAKALAMTGLEVIGRDYYGVFPLRGKFLNVREANNTSIMQNQEVSDLFSILGFDKNEKYNNESDLTKLRYGSIMIMADQDHDGSHIKGLIINFIHYFWPNLIKQTSYQFMKEFITPIIKASKGKEVRSFFTVGQFREWALAKLGEIKHWKIKYYKGLGTSDDKEAKEYFMNIEQHKICFFCQDERKTDDAIDLAFNKKKANERKEWLKTYDPAVVVDHSIKRLSYDDFVDKELIHFSVANNLRAIPNIVDGMKTGQRKILYCCFKRNLTKEIKVAQLAGYVAEHSEYHHGEQNLADTIVGMAQTFVGANNIHLLMPNGQFGSRAMGGKDAASARYLHTVLSKITRFIFRPEDDPILDYIEEDGKYVEPRFYVPIIPMALVNGCDGIGSGWATSIPNYKTQEVIKNLRKLIRGEQANMMHPEFKGYTGTIEPLSEGSYRVRGSFSYYPEENVIEITELPIRKWTRDFKSAIEKMMTSKDPQPINIDNMEEFHTSRRVHFKLYLKEGDPELEDHEIDKLFKLTSSLATSNMVLFDPALKIRKYDNVMEILSAFYEVRLDYYSKRKAYQLKVLEREVMLYKQKKLFVEAVNDGRIIFSKRNKKEIIQQLRREKFLMESELPEIRSKADLAAELRKKQDEEEKLREEQEDAGITLTAEEVEVRETEQSSEVEGFLREYDYLLSMKIYSLGLDEVHRLKTLIEKKEAEYQTLKKIHESDIWLKDLDSLEDALEKFEAQERKQIEEDDKKAAKPKKGPKHQARVARVREKEPKLASEHQELESKPKKPKDPEDQDKKDIKKIVGPKGARTDNQNPKVKGFFGSSSTNKPPPARPKETREPSPAKISQETALARLQSSMLRGHYGSNPQTDREIMEIMAMSREDLERKAGDLERIGESLSMKEKIRLKELKGELTGKQTPASSSGISGVVPASKTQQVLSNFFNRSNQHNAFLNLEDSEDEFVPEGNTTKKRPFIDEEDDY
jgi:DNA topoisomerase II